MMRNPLRVRRATAGLALACCLAARPAAAQDAVTAADIHQITCHVMTVPDVAAAIRAKTGISADQEDEAFLRDYYAALRLRLERGLLLGRRKANKHET